MQPLISQASRGRRIGIWLAVSGLLPLIIFGAIVWRLGTSSLYAQAGQRLQTAAVNQQIQIDTWLDRLSGTLYSMTSANVTLNQAIAGQDKSTISGQLATSLAAQPGDPGIGDGFSELFAVGADGRLITSTSATRQTLPGRSCPITQICLFGPFAEGSQFWIGVQYPIQATNTAVANQPIGALIGLADARHFDLLLDNDHAYLEGAVGDLRWLPRYGLPTLTAPLPIHPALLTVSDPAVYNGIHGGINGSPVFGVSLYIPRLSAWLIEEEAVAEIEQPLAFLPAALISIGALTLALILLFNRLLTRQLDNERAAIYGQLAARESQIRAMEDAARVRNQTIATMSHELRTSLSATLNFSGFLLDGLFGELSADQIEPTRQIYESAAHLLDLINDLLDIARVELGQMRLFPLDFDPAPLFDQTIATLHALTLGKPIAIRTDFPTAWPLIHGDRRRILQILLNLIANAAKFTEQGMITVRVHTYLDKLEVRVEDTGSGIAPDEVADLFTPFHQGHNAALLEKGGTGLGLPLSRIFARLHGGDLTYQPGATGGSVFIVQLPIKPPPAKIDLAAADPS